MHPGTDLCGESSARLSGPVHRSCRLVKYRSSRITQKTLLVEADVLVRWWRPTAVSLSSLALTVPAVMWVYIITTTLLIISLPTTHELPSRTNFTPQNNLRMNCMQVSREIRQTMTALPRLGGSQAVAFSS